MLNQFKQQGLTLVELVMVMVVLAIGLGGVLMVMISMTSFSMTPVISWQSAVIADNVMALLLEKEFPGFELCSKAPLNEKESHTLCEDLKAQKKSASDILKEMNTLKSISEYAVSIIVVPFPSSPQIAQITVSVENPHTGKTVLTALKAPNQMQAKGNDEN